MENSQLANIGTTDIELSAAEMEMLKDIASGGASNFMGVKRDGLQIGQEFFNEVFVQVVRIDRYSYRWEGGSDKIIDRTMSRDDAKAAGFAEGMDLTLKLLKPEFEEEFTLSMPQSSCWNFSKYVAFLLSKNVHPKMVITKIKATLKQFKKGSPVAVATFEAAGVIQPDAVNVTPQKDEPTPQPQPAQTPETGTPQQADIPSEWT